MILPMCLFIYRLQLPEFLELCKDDVWGVRKGCAEIFTEIARLCQLATRRDTLTPVFVKLLQDSTRWVKVAAYQSLGPFIATFSVEADSPVEVPELTEFEKTFIERVRENHCLALGEGQLHKHRSSMLGSASTEDLTSICIQDDNDDEDDEEKGSKEGDEGNEEKSSSDENTDNLPPIVNSICTKLYSVKAEDDGGGEEETTPNVRTDSVVTAETEISSSLEGPLSVSPQVTVSENESSGEIHIHVEKDAPQELAQICRSSSVLSHRPSSIGNTMGGSATCSTSSSTTTNCGVVTTENTPTFNTFQYWRIPLPDIELDIGMVEGKPASVHVRAKVEDPQMNLTYQSELSVNLSSEVVQPNDPPDTEQQENNNVKKVENIQIQTLSSTSVTDNDNDTTKRLESSMKFTTVNLCDKRVTGVHQSYMDLYNVSDASMTTANVTTNSAADATVVSIDDYNKVLEDIPFDYAAHMGPFDDDSDDQMNSCSYNFGDER